MKTKIHICSKRATERSAIYHPVAEFIYKFDYWWHVATLTARTSYTCSLCSVNDDSVRAGAHNKPVTRVQTSSQLASKVGQTLGSANWLIVSLSEATKGPLKDKRGQLEAWSLVLQCLVSPVILLQLNVRKLKWCKYFHCKAATADTAGWPHSLHWLHQWQGLKADKKTKSN